MNISNISSQISQNIFSKLDTEGQGYLSQEVLSSAFGSLNSSAADSDAESLVSAMDSDSDGQISKSELTKGVENLIGQLRGSQQRPIGGLGGLNGLGPMNGMPPFSLLGSDEEGGITAEQAANIAQSTENEGLSKMMNHLSENFDQIDTDADGIVTKEEGMAYKVERFNGQVGELSSGFDLTAMQNVAKLIAAYGFGESETESSVSISA